MYDGLYLVSIACVWPNINKVRLYSERLAAACRRMQTNADACRRMQANTKQTVSSAWVDTNARHIQMLHGCSKSFWMRYNKEGLKYVFTCYDRHKLEIILVKYLFMCIGWRKL